MEQLLFPVVSVDTTPAQQKTEKNKQELATTLSRDTEDICKTCNAPASSECEICMGCIR